MTAPAIALAIALTAALAAAATLAALWARQRARLHHLERDIERLQQQTREAQHAADTFFDTVGHELRSPVAAIIGYQELLGDGAYGDIGPAAREPLDRIGRSVYHLLDLIDGTLDLARIRAGTAAPDLANADLGLLIDDIATAFRSHAEERSLRHYVRIEHPLPTIRSDFDRLARALRLLAIHAVKHPAGERLELRVQRHPDGATVQIRGIRLPTRHEAHDPALRTGIRLAIAAGVADLLGHDLQAQPASDDGVHAITFRIRDAAASGL
jgi:signal transduction histidine kinase